MGHDLMPHFYLRAGRSGNLGGWIRPAGRRAVMAFMVVGGGGRVSNNLAVWFPQGAEDGGPSPSSASKSLGNLSVSFRIFVPLDLIFPIYKIRELD